MAAAAIAPSHVQHSCSSMSLQAEQAVAVAVGERLSVSHIGASLYQDDCTLLLQKDSRISSAAVAATVRAPCNIKASAESCTSPHKPPAAAAAGAHPMAKAAANAVRVRVHSLVAQAGPLSAPAAAAAAVTATAKPPPSMQEEPRSQSQAEGAREEAAAAAAGTAPDAAGAVGAAAAAEQSSKEAPQKGPASMSAPAAKDKAARAQAAQAASSSATSFPATTAAGSSSAGPSPGSSQALAAACAAALAACKLGLVDQLAAALAACPAAANAKDPDGRGCLHFAAGYGQEESVSLLLSKGADPRARDGKGEVALHMAAVLGHPMCAYTIAQASGEVRCSSGVLGSMVWTMFLILSDISTLCRTQGCGSTSPRM